MRLYTRLATILPLLWISLATSAFAQTDLVEALDRELIPLSSTESTSDFSDLERLKPILKDKRIVALGEATHGTHEFFTTKHRKLKSWSRRWASKHSPLKLTLRAHSR